MGAKDKGTSHSNNRKKARDAVVDQHILRDLALIPTYPSPSFDAFPWLRHSERSRGSKLDLITTVGGCRESLRMVGASYIPFGRVC